MNRLTASQTGSFSAKSIRLRENSINQIQLQINAPDAPLDITYTIDQHPQIVKTLSGGGIVLNDDANGQQIYTITILGTDYLKHGYWDHFVQIVTPDYPDDSYTTSLDKGRVRIER